MFWFTAGETDLLYFIWNLHLNISFFYKIDVVIAREIGFTKGNVDFFYSLRKKELNPSLDKFI